MIDMERSMKRPKVIFIDAVGTLFGVKGGVGEIYSEIARDFEVEVSPEVLNQAFNDSFKAATSPVFPDADEKDIPQLEFEWWKDIATRTFEKAGVIEQFPDFPGFFSELYIHFGTAEAWFVYPDVVPALINWRRMGIELGVLSNFDSRIYSVLQALELREFFGSVTICSQVGVAKPNPEIFAIALSKHNCSPQAAWHIGDDIDDDYQGAKSAGVRGIWINRSQTSQKSLVPS